MGFRQWAEATAIIQALKHVEKKGKVADLATSIDQLIDKRFPKRSENIQQKIVQMVLIPLSRELMKELPFTFQKVLMDEVQKISERS